MRTRTALVIMLTLLSLFTLVPAADADGGSYEPQPDWSSSDGGQAQRAAWGCRGHVDPPETAYQGAAKGVLYDAHQYCEGEFGAQKVCVQLWDLDYFGNPSLVSTMSCGPATVSTHAYRSRFLTCAEIGDGHVRYFTKAKGYAYPNGVTTPVGAGQSVTATLC